jgi:hypothetical protein
MTAPMVHFPDDCQRQPLQGLQQAHLSCHRLMNEADHKPDVSLQPYGSRPAAITPQRALPQLFLVTGKHCRRQLDLRQRAQAAAECLLPGQFATPTVQPSAMRQIHPRPAGHQIPYCQPVVRTDGLRVIESAGTRFRKRVRPPDILTGAMRVALVKSGVIIYSSQHNTMPLTHCTKRTQPSRVKTKAKGLNNIATTSTVVSPGPRCSLWPP